MFERDDYDTTALSRFEYDTAAQEREFERKLAIFRQSPYEHAEFMLNAFDKYDLLNLALVFLLDQYDTEAAANHRPSQCAIKDCMAALDDAIWQIE